MAQNVSKVQLRESNNHPQGRSGGGGKKLPGPVKSVKANPTKSGGIFRATKSGSNY